MPSLFSKFTGGAAQAGAEAGKAALDAAKKAKDEDLLKKLKAEKEAFKKRNKELSKIGASIGDPLSVVAENFGKKLALNKGALGKFTRTLAKFAGPAFIGALAGQILVGAVKSFQQARKKGEQDAKRAESLVSELRRNPILAKEIRKQAGKAERTQIFQGLPFLDQFSKSAAQKERADSAQRQYDAIIGRRAVAQISGINTKLIVARAEAEAGKPLSGLERVVAIDDAMLNRYGVNPDSDRVSREWKNEYLSKSFIERRKADFDKSIESAARVRIAEELTLKGIKTVKAQAESREVASAFYRDNLTPAAAMKRGESRRTSQILIKSTLSRHRQARLD